MPAPREQIDLVTQRPFIEVQRFRQPTVTRGFAIGSWVPLDDGTAVCLAGSRRGRAYAEHNAILADFITSTAAAAAAGRALVDGNDGGGGSVPTERIVEILSRNRDAFDRALNSMLALNYSPESIAELEDAGLLARNLMPWVVAIAADQTPAVEVREKDPQ